MAAITSAANGNWSATSTWTGGVVPGDGDTVTITHDMTIDVDVVIGSSPATGGTAAILFDTTAPQVSKTLTINAGMTLRLRGDFNQKPYSGGTTRTNLVYLNAGAKVVFDPPNSSTQYKWNFNTAGTNGQISINGTSGSHCTFRTDFTRAGGTGLAAYMAFAASSGTQGILYATYCDFNDLGTSSNWGLQWILGNNWTTTANGLPANCTVSNCTFTRCNCSLTQVNAWDGNLTFDYNKLTSSVAGPTNSDTVYMSFSSNQSAGVRLFSRNDFSGRVELSGNFSHNWQCNIFRGSLYQSGGSGTTGWGLCDSNIFVGAGPQVNAASIANCYLYNAAETSNASGMVVYLNGSDITVDRCIFEAPLNTGQADILWPPSNTAVAHTMTITRCLSLPSVANGAGPGLLSASIMAATAEPWRVRVRLRAPTRQVSACLSTSGPCLSSVRRCGLSARS